MITTVPLSPQTRAGGSPLTARRQSACRTSSRSAGRSARGPRRRPQAPVRCPLDSYYTDVGGIRLLDGAAEKELARRVMEGDADARNAMVLANLRLVVHIAQTYSRAGRELQDLIADGNLGLISAVERFDPAQGVRFGTYASYWIRQAIQRGIQKTALPVRLPGYVCILLVKWRRAAAELRDQTGRNPTRDEVAQRLGLSKRTRHIVDRALDTAAGAGPSDPLPKTTSVETAVEDLRTPSPAHELEQEFTREWAHDLLARLGQREAAVLRMRFGLEGEKPRTLQEVGQCLDLTRERVRQIERQALERARKHLAG